MKQIVLVCLLAEMDSYEGITVESELDHQCLGSNTIDMHGVRNSQISVLNTPCGVAVFLSEEAE